MATEIACIDVLHGHADGFLVSAQAAVDLFRHAGGCSAMRMARSHEVTDRFWLIVEWDDVAAHEAFRGTPAFARWRELVGPHFAQPPKVEHGLPTAVAFRSL